MRSSRLPLLSLVIAACLGAFALASSAVSSCRRTISLAAAYVLDGLKLFAEPEQLVQKRPEVRTGLTARERYDLNGDGFARPRVERSWRMCPSA